MRVGFIGLGIMGAPMAGHLLDAKHELTVFNRTAAKCEPLRARGARVAASPGEVGQASEFVFLCVSDTPDVEAVLFGTDGVAEGIAKGSVVIDCSTISADATVNFARRLAEQSVAFLDAPLTGGDVGARNATLTIMVGGDERAFQRALPLLQCVGKMIVHMGASGAGQRTKMVNQIICALNVLGMAEGLAFAERAGLDVEKVLQVVSSGAAGSWTLTNYAPRILRGDYAPGFPMHLQAKDLRLCREAIARLGGRFEGTELTHRLFTEASESGLAEQGTQGLINLLRRAK
jgi:3-hydroxyisobutyrate dehydrogenase-like beta-hydroxyacid dehydrogenase